MAKEIRRQGAYKVDTRFTLYPTTLDIIDVRRGNLSRSAFVDVLVQEIFADDLKEMHS